MRIHRFLLFLLLMLPMLMPSATAAQNQAVYEARVTQVDTSRYPEITVYVAVTNAAGQLVPNLTVGDVQLTEDGTLVAIERMAGGGGGAITAVLVIDRSLSMENAGKMDGAQAAALAFVAQMRPGDQTGILAFNSEAEWANPISADATDLDLAIRRLRPEGGTAIYDSVLTALETLQHTSGRPVLLVLTDGADCRDDPDCPDSYGSDASLAQTIAVAQRAGQPVHVIGLGERSSNGRDRIDETVLRQLAEQTGGNYMYAPTAADLVQLYRSFAVQVQQEYAITYRSPRPFYDGTRRDIRVTIGEAPPAQANYLQEHLINVRSDPVAGVILLTPILCALALPGLVSYARRTATKRMQQPPASAAAPVADGATIIAPTAMLIRYCQNCGSELPEDERFCRECGASTRPQEAMTVKYCIECGRPVRQGARFCAGCGAPVMSIQ